MLPLPDVLALENFTFNFTAVEAGTFHPSKLGINRIRCVSHGTLRASIHVKIKHIN
jgi:hypothetical protein